MKIYETKPAAQNLDGTYGAYNTRACMVGELGDNIFIQRQMHTKSTLAPVFGKQVGWYGNQHNVMLLHNSIGMQRDYESTNAAMNGQNDNNYGSDPSYHVTSNRQLQMAGHNAKKAWRSTYDTTKIYFTSSYDYNHNALYVHEYDVTTKTFSNTKVHSAKTCMSTAWFYEDATYVYGSDAGGNTLYTAYSRIIRLNKTSLGIDTLGTYRRYDIHRILHVTDEYVLYYLDSGNYSSGRRASTVMLNRWSDAVNHTTGINRKFSDDDYWNNGGLDMQKADGTRFWALQYHSNTMTDGLQVHTGGADTSRPHWSQPAIVHDHAGNLRDTHKVIRYYMAVRNTGGSLSINRVNIPLPDHANAFSDVSDGRPGGLAYGTPTVPTYDMRKCTLTALAGLPSVLNEANMFGDNGLIYAGNNSYIYKSYNLSFFEDANGKGFLILDFAGENTYQYASGTYRAQSIWVLEIVNYAASITDQLHETNSLELKVIQEIDLGYNPMALYRPTDDPELFIAMNFNAAGSKIFTWNKSSKEFQEGATLGGEIMCIGNDSSGNIYSIQMGGGNRRYEIHTETPTLPNQIKVTPANERFNFAGSPIASTVDIEAFNYLGDRIAATVNLQIIGEGVVFTSGSATSAGKALTVTTSSSAAITENISVTQATFVKINASMSV